MDTPDFSHLTTADYENIYEPSEDSFFLLDALEKDLSNILDQDPVICVELGPGSGILVTALAKYTKAYCLAVDISPFACKATQKTAAINNVTVDLVNGNLLKSFRDNSIDLLIFNPPYVPSRLEETENFEADVQHSSQSIVQTWAGGISGREVIDQFLSDLERVLAPNGVVYLLLLQENRPDEIVECMKVGFEAEIFMERLIIGEYLLVVKLRKAK